MKKLVIIGVMLLLFTAWFGIATAEINILGGLSREKNAKPGEIYENEIIIRNKGEGIQEVKLYQTDYLFFSDGSNIYGEPGKISRSNAKWITFRPKRLKIGPKQQEAVHYTVAVPKDTGLVGTFWSILMVEPISEDSPESTQAKERETSIGVRQVFRYGIQISSHIDDTGVGMLKFSGTKLLKENNVSILKVDVENTGEIFLRPLLSVELYNEKGGFVGRYKGKRFRTYPGTSVRFKVDLGKIDEGIYKALVVADCGGDDVFGATYNIKIRNNK